MNKISEGQGVKIMSVPVLRGPINKTNSNQLTFKTKGSMTDSINILLKCKNLNLKIF